MSRERVVLVGLDGSKQADRALAWALDEARRRDWSLRLVCAYTMPSFVVSPVGAVASADEAMASAAQEILDEAAERCRRAGVPVTTEVQAGSPAGVLVDRSAQAGLLVVGSRGRGGFAGLLLGSVSSAAAAHAKSPVVVIHQPDGAPDARDSEDPASRAMAAGRVVVGVDGTDRDNPALLVAAEEAQLRGVGLTVLGATQVPGGAWAPVPTNFQLVQDAYAESLEECADVVHEQHPGLDVAWRLADAPPVPALVEASRSAELVVVGSRGRGGFTGLLLGSTSQAVLQYAQGPVMVVPVGDRRRG